MVEKVKLLSEPTNYAVVHLPGRIYPGVVFQGDALLGIISELGRVKKSMDSNNLSEASDELFFLMEKFEEIMSYYVSVCKKNGISLPHN